MPPNDTVALVPLRPPGVGKTRLSPTLSPDQRAELAGAMLADVTAALAAAPVDRIVVAGGGPAAATAAAALGIEVLLDPPGTSSLDEALAVAASQLLPAGRLLVVAADLPALTAEDVAAILAADAPVAVAPTVDGGTGGLLREPPGVIGTAYGPGSAERHVGLARTAGLAPAVVHAAGFATDVDTVADLGRLAATSLGEATARWLAACGLDLPRVS